MMRKVSKENCFFSICPLKLSYPEYFQCFRESPHFLSYFFIYKGNKNTSQSELNLFILEGKVANVTLNTKRSEGVFRKLMFIYLNDNHFSLTLLCLSSTQRKSYQVFIQISFRVPEFKTQWAVGRR